MDHSISLQILESLTDASGKSIKAAEEQVLKVLFTFLVSHSFFKTENARRFIWTESPHAHC